MLTAIAGNARAQFPYIESFRNATAPGINFGGAPSAFLTAGGSGYDLATKSHVGTPVDANGSGYLRLTNRLQNQKGYVYSESKFPSTNGLSVEFEYYIYGGSGADGISFFLFDATADPFIIGGFGGSLGYAQITTTDPISKGVSKGYLAVGLDEFGNFSNPTEGRQGGIFGLRPGSVTLRGKGDGAALTSGNYAYLTTARTADLGFSLVGDITSRQPDQTSTGYRRVYMDMVPNPKGGYNITVKITRGGATPQTSTVIDNFYYSEPAPANLKYGLASSTGNQTNFHEIRNVLIDVLQTSNLVAPVAVHDQLSLCQGKIGIIDVTANDKTDNAGGTINKASIDLDPSAVGIQSTFKVPGKGEFSINSDGNVVFTPETPFIGNVSANYTVKDTYGKLSNVADIILTYAAAPAQPTAGTDQLLNISTTTGSYNLQGSNPGINTGKWALISGPTSFAFTNSSMYNTTVSNLAGGTYVFRWSVTSAGGCELFDDVQIIVNHIPVANDDKITTNLNTDIRIPILDNDTDADGNSTIDRSSISIKSQPQHGTLVTDPVTGIVTYRPTAGYSGYDSFVYTVKDNYGAESNTAIVNIAVNIKPIGVNDISTTAINTPVTIHVLDNDPDKTGAIVIKNSDPLSGTVVLNPDGTFTYTPNANFVGTDTFTYKLRNKDGLESDPILVTVNVTGPILIPAKIGLAKAVTSNVRNQDGTYTIKYRFTIINYGEVATERLSLADDLNLAFKDVKYTVSSIAASGSLKANQLFNGNTVQEMLLNTSTLPGKSKEYVDLELVVALVDKEGTFNNTAFAKAYSVSDGSITQDQSTDGLFPDPDPSKPGDVSPAVPTPITLTYQEIFIPGGFSPNGDGINDNFVIQNTSGKQILLEVYNRWGNRIYRSVNYKNEWNGKTTEGIHVGDEVPTGTYYYIVMIDGKDKRVGHLTITR